MSEATFRYRAARAGPHGWLLGPMLVRASQLGETEEVEPLGVVVDVEPGQLDGWFAQVERRGPATEEMIGRLASLADIVYLEGDLLDLIASARDRGLDVRAKIRTGGATADAFPAPAEAARFIADCVRRNVPFKATAGLHHPFRHPSVVPEATEHGFVNIMAAVRCSVSGDEEAAQRALEETDPAAFDTHAMSWRGVGSATPPELVRRIFTSIGSCSFEEPAGYLTDLGLL